MREFNDEFEEFEEFEFTPERLKEIDRKNGWHQFKEFKE